LRQVDLYSSAVSAWRFSLAHTIFHVIIEPAQAAAADCRRLILHQSIFNRARPRAYISRLSCCGEMHINPISSSRRRESRKCQIKVRARCNKAILYMIYLPSACAQIQPKLNFYCLLCYLNRRAQCSKGCWRQRAPHDSGAVLELRNQRKLTCYAIIC
jgi:hypothetical protein